MQNYKIIEVLKSLNKKEFKKFGEYVYSPFFNKNGNVRKLYDSLSKYYPKFDSRNVTVEKIFEKVFPKDKYNYFKISNVISDLYKLSESYLYYIGVSKENISYKHNLLKELSERGLDVIYEHTEKIYKKEIDNLKVKDENYYNYLYRFYTESLNYNISKKPVDHPKIIQSQFENFLNYSNVSLLKLYMYMHHLKKQNKVVFNMEMFESFSSYVKAKDFEDNPAYMIYKGIMMLEFNKEKRYFLKLKEIKNKYADKISSSDLHNVLIFMHSFTAEMINKDGDEDFQREEFVLIKEMIDRKIYTPKNMIYPNLINIYKSACTQKEYEWANKFLQDCLKNIPEKDKSNTLNCCIGYMHYRKKNFSKALESFAKTNFQWFILKIFVKTLTLRIYYEEEMFEQAFNFIDSFRHYLQNDDKIIEEHKAAHIIFLKYLTSLIKIRMSSKSNSFEIKKLNENIVNMENNSFGVKQWLLRKIKEVK
ncbi:MAG: hypothetical protein M3R36_02795 [Bacteroidota bacterium]|nr:hypothetical protein [Bacteroidota bacterium]